MMLRAAESAGFEIRDVENLREHYGLTLRRWLRNLEARHSEARAFVSEETYRVWRLYLAGSGHCFRSGQLGVYQTLPAKLDDTEMEPRFATDRWLLGFTLVRTSASLPPATLTEGREHFQEAKAIIVAGYAIETPRLLLNSARRGHENGLANS
jgi:Mycolic acid cyclopropane synthetase